MRYVMFGTERHAHIFSLRHSIARKDISLATNPSTVEFIRGEKELTVVTVPAEMWRPPTFPCEVRVKETSDAIKNRKEQGVVIKWVKLE